jgi:hypothetical protein
VPPTSSFYTLTLDVLICVRKMEWMITKVSRNVSTISLVCDNATYNKKEVKHQDNSIPADKGPERDNPQSNL